MDDDARVRALDRISLILGTLGTDDETVVTSIRVPVALREAALALQDAGLIGSWNEVVVGAARDRIEALAHHAGLEAHYTEHPELRPTLAELAMAHAELVDSPLAQRPEVIERAAAELGDVKSDADGEDVLVYASALLAHAIA